MDAPTAQQIAQNYSAAMDSVNLINGAQPSNMSNQDWQNCLQRNHDHLNIMLAQTYWTTENLQPFTAAVAASATAIAALAAASTAAPASIPATATTPAAPAASAASTTTTTA
jgi:mevalonate pyrophosphate decarboxylase